MAECTYTAETGPIRGRGDIDFERDEEKKERQQNRVFSDQGKRGEKERDEDKEDLEKEDAIESRRERETPLEVLLLQLCSVSADLLHALRGEALLELWRQKSEKTVYVHLSWPSKGDARDRYLDLDSRPSSALLFSSIYLSLIYPTLVVYLSLICLPSI